MDVEGNRLINSCSFSFDLVVFLDLELIELHNCIHIILFSYDFPYMLYMCF